jgi:hypothetical protein
MFPKMASRASDGTADSDLNAHPGPRRCSTRPRGSRLGSTSRHWARKTNPAWSPLLSR